MDAIRECRPDETRAMLEIVNAAARAYRGVIPGDCWHEPYMSPTELRRDIDAGVRFWGFETEGALVAVMGIQPVRDVHLIRHAYVDPGFQHRGIGRALIAHLRELAPGSMLVGTWADASWAIRFYESCGFERVGGESAQRLLQSYWSIPQRQREVSVALAAPPWRET